MALPHSEQQIDAIQIVDAANAIYATSTAHQQTPAGKAEDKKKARRSEGIRDRIRARLRSFGRALRSLRGNQMSGPLDSGPDNV